MSEIKFEVPNLDCASMDPEDYTKLGETLRDLAQYTSRKAVSVKARLQGKITVAVQAEESMERIYQRLPEWARW